MNTMDDNAKELVKPCAKCGACDRNPSGKCRPCALAYAAEYRKQNKDKVQASQAAYREANRDKARERTAKWRADRADSLKQYYAERYQQDVEARREKARKAYASNPKLAREKKAAWVKANPDRQLEIGRAYRQRNLAVCQKRERDKRAMRRAAPGRLSVDISQRLFAIQKGLCACCKKPLGADYHLDHIVPLAIGGSNTDDNVQLLRRRCNQEKGKKHPVDFMQSRGYLL